MSRPILLLGEASNAATATHPRLWLMPDKSEILHSANRLLDYTGYDLDTYLRTFDRDNLIHQSPPRQARGRSFSAATARRAARRIFDHGDRWRGIVMLGKRVASAFSWVGDDDAIISNSRLPLLCWHRVVELSRPSPSTIPAAIIPHPSGVNRWWNVPENRRDARQFFRDVLG